ncbi:MAG: hypothetical protein V4719_25945 [Planctomycetota bacterium]
MTNEPDDKLSGLLAQAVEQLVKTPRSNERPDDLDALVLQKLSRAAESPSGLASTAVTRRKEKHPMLLLVKYSVVASLLIVAGAVTWLGLAGGTNSVYGAVAKRLENLRSIVYRVQWVEEARLINAVAGDGDKVLHLVPSHDRIERLNGTVLVVDTDAQKAIDFNPAMKTALLMTGNAASDMAILSRGPVRLLETLRKHFRVGNTLPAGVEALPVKEIGGIRTQGLRSTLDGEIVEAWIDPRTSLPLEIRICLVIPSHVSGSAGPAIRMWRVMSAFEYDVAIDPSLMSVEVPAGYTAIEMPQLPVAKKAAASSLTDLIAVLRLCAQYNDSLFPDSLAINDDPGTCMAIMKRYAKKQDELLKAGTAAEKQVGMKTAMEFGTAIGRVTPFLFSLRPENKLRYVGAGVKLNAPEQPILWFSPQGDAQYQVVYADLSVKTVAESALPKLPEPKLENPQPSVRTTIRSISPRVTLPQSATKTYDALQNIRLQAGQDKVRFIDLHLIPEFLKNDATPDAKVDSGTPRYQFLEEFRNLEGLNVQGLFLTENDLEVIGRCQSLKSLSLSGIEITEASGGKHRLQGSELRHLSGLKKLEMLDLSQSQFSGGLQHLSELPKLQTLILSSFENVNDASIAQFKELPHLKTLVLAAVYGENREVTETGLASLKELSSLRTLYVESHGKWTLPVEKLQALLPGVKVQRGFLEVPESAQVKALRQYAEQLHQKAPAVGPGSAPRPATEAPKK